MDSQGQCWGLTPKKSEMNWQCWSAEVPASSFYGYREKSMGKPVDKVTGLSLQLQCPDSGPLIHAPAKVRTGKGRAGTTDPAWRGAPPQPAQPLLSSATSGRWLKVWVLHIKQGTGLEEADLGWIPAWRRRAPTAPSWSACSKDASPGCKATDRAVTRGTQHASSPACCCGHQSTPWSRKQPLPQQTQRFTHLSRNGTSICRRRSRSIRFALNPMSVKAQTGVEGNRDGRAASNLSLQLLLIPLLTA